MGEAPPPEAAPGMPTPGWPDASVPTLRRMAARQREHAARFHRWADAADNLAARYDERADAKERERGDAVGLVEAMASWTEEQWADPELRTFPFLDDDDDKTP